METAATPRQTAWHEAGHGLYRHLRICPAGRDISDTRIWSVLTTAPGATADATGTRPRHAGMAADPFWHNVLESARAIVFEGCAATRPGTAILSRRATVRCRL